MCFCFVLFLQFAKSGNPTVEPDCLALNPGPALISCVTMGSLSNLSVPCLPYKMKTLLPTLEIFWENYMIFNRSSI